MASKSDSDELGDRMKAYEAAETGRVFDAMLPIYARMDGRSFSRFTRGMERPFDQRLALAMVANDQATDPRDPGCPWLHAVR
jgi:hypothetical protein